MKHVSASFGLLTIVIIGLCAFTGCQKKVAKVDAMESVTNKQEFPVVESKPKQIDTDSTSFVAANLKGEFLRESQEVLKNIYFNFDQSVILPNSEAQLALIGKFMIAHPSMRILIAGNCDDRGSSEYNIALGEKRARVVNNYLVTYGIPQKSIEVTSYGKERNAVSGCTDESCNAKNRRDEFTVLDNTM